MHFLLLSKCILWTVWKLYCSTHCVLHWVTCSLTTNNSHNPQTVTSVKVKIIELTCVWTCHRVIKLCPGSWLAGVGSVISLNPLMLVGGIRDPQDTLVRTHTPSHTSLRLSVSCIPVHSASLIQQHTNLQQEMSPVTILSSENGSSPTVDLVAGNLRWSYRSKRIYFIMYPQSCTYCCVRFYR